jgi:Ca2+-binding EF-hand superfamily protein
MCVSLNCFTKTTCIVTFKIDVNKDGLISFNELMIAMRAVELDRDGSGNPVDGTFTRSGTALR